MTVIANSAFFNSGLTSVVIPASVTSIESLAFSGSSDLISITFLGNAPEQVGGAFDGLADDATAFIGADATGFDLQNGLWNLLKVVRANPPAGAGAAPSSSAVSPALHLDARFRVGELAANQTVLAEGQGLQPHSAFSLTLRSTPQTLADGVANGGGLFSTVVSVPSDIPAGFHTITLNATGVGGELLTLVSGFTVDERGVVTSVTSSVSPPSRQLAETGPAHDVLTAVAFAGGLALLVGIVLVGVRRVLVRV